jgi:hypothetical protein
MMGYRKGEVMLSHPGPVKKEYKVKVKRVFEKNMRKPALVSMGPHLNGECSPHPDLNDNDTLIGGVEKRVATEPPPHSRKFRRKFRKFVKNWIRKNITPLSPDLDISFEKWIERTNYPEWRKQDLKKSWDKLNGVFDEHDPRMVKVKCFPKDETYFGEFKNARGIYARVDEFKCFAGPIFKAVEDVLYQLPEFIKHVPVKDRPEYIKSRLYRIGCKYAATDFTAFESHFTKEMMNDCEFQLYKHLFKFHPMRRKMWFIMNVLEGKNVCEYKNFVVYLLATRMSGEMNTSAGNGFSNLMFILFVCEESGCTDVAIVVEGDDGLFCYSGPDPDPELFLLLGLRVKIEYHEELNTASFCGLVFDLEEKCNVADATKILTNFAWSSGKYVSSSDNKLKGLLRCKALSLAYQYPGCPVVSSLARYGLRVTKGFYVDHLIEKDRNMDSYTREKFRQSNSFRDLESLVNRPVGFKTRALMEKKFGLSIENQLYIERILDEKEDLGPICLGFTLNSTNAEYFNKYSTTEVTSSVGPVVCEHLK